MANGKFGGGKGTSAEPYIVEDFADFDAIRNKPKQTYYYYKLVNHIDMDVTTLPEEGWSPIPDFYGSFDGNYNCIHNLKINRLGTDNVGLFGNLASSTVVKNLMLVDIDIKGHDYVGGLVGLINGDDVSIDTVSVCGKVNGNNSVGGLVGHSGSRKKVKLNKVITECEVTATGNNIGGLAGTFTSFSDDSTKCTVNKAFIYGTVSGENFITTNASVGLADYNVGYTEVYFDKNKLSKYYPDEHATGKEKSFFQDKYNFESYLNDMYKTQCLWRFSKRDYLRFSFSNNYAMLFEIDGVLNKFDVATDEFVPLTNIPQNPTWHFYEENGLRDASVISIANWRNLLARKVPVRVVMGYDSSKKIPATAYPQLQILNDAETQGISLEISTIEPKDNLKIKDYNPANVRYNTFKDAKVEAQNFKLHVDTENEISEIQKGDTVAGAEFKIISDKKELTDDSFEANLTYNSYNGKVTNSALNDKRSIEIFSSEQKEIQDIGVNVGIERNKSAHKKGENITKDTNVGVYYDTAIPRQTLNTNIIYTLFNTITSQNRGIHVNAHGKNSSRYLLSVNNGQTWLSFNSKNNTWVDTNLSDIYDAGVTASDLESRTVMNALPTTYQSKVKIAAAISAEAFNSTFSIRDFDIEFEPNEGPNVLDFVEKDNSDCVTISGILHDKENDNVSYRVLTKHQIETDFRQILPSNEGGWLRKKNGYKFEERFPLSTFKNGTNVIMIETKDARGEVYEKKISFTLIQGSPEIKINSQNQFYANLTLSHTLKKKVRFQIFINGNQKAPVKEGEWSEWKDTTEPYTFDYTWNTKDLLNGLPNELEIKVQDEMQTEVFAKFNVIGEYKSLLFKDQNNFYYSTDTGEVLQQLDFGTVIGGVLSDVYPVVIENKTGLSMDNIVIFPDANTQEELSKIKISHTAPDSKAGFVPSEETIVVKNYNSDATSYTEQRYENAIKVPYVLDNNDTYTFYVRIESDDEVASYKNKVFRVLASGTPIDSSMVTVVLPDDAYDDYFYDSTPYLDDGEGLFNIKLIDLEDKMGINGKSIYIAGNNVFTWANERITLEQFMADPISAEEHQKSIFDYQNSNAEFTPYAVRWLDEFFVANYGDTVANLVNNGNLQFERRLRTNNYYDGHVAWLKADPDNKNKKFTNKYYIVEK